MPLFNFIAKLFGGIALITALVLGGLWLWHRPERWNDTAEGYQSHAATLQVDSVASRAALLMQGSLMAGQNRTIDTLRGQVSTLTVRAKDAENASLQARIDLSGANTRIAQSVAAMTALQRKQAADADGGGIGIVPTTVADSGANAAIASLKGQVREKDGVIIALTSENSALKAENGTLKDEVSDLERNLNGARGEVKAAVRGVIEQPKGFPVGRLARERKRLYKVLAQ